MIGTIFLGGRKGFGGVGLGSLSGISVPANQAPSITVPGSQSATSNVALAITGTSIADADGNSQTLTITTNQSGTISLASTSGLTGSGNGTASLSYSGTLANINTAIATLTYTSASNYSGSETITIGTNDGSGGTDSKTIAVSVTWSPLSIPGLIVGVDFNWLGGYYKDAGTTPAAVGDTIQRVVARFPLDGSVYFEHATAKPTLMQGANGKLFLRFTRASSHRLVGVNTSSIFGSHANHSLFVFAKRTASGYQGIIGSDNVAGSNGMTLSIDSGGRHYVAYGGSYENGTNTTSNWRRYVGDALWNGTNNICTPNENGVDTHQSTGTPSSSFGGNGQLCLGASPQPTNFFGGDMGGWAGVVGPVMSSADKALLDAFQALQEPT